MRAVPVRLSLRELVLFLRVRDRNLERGPDLCHAFAQCAYSHLLARAAARDEVRLHHLVSDHAELSLEHFAEVRKLPPDIREKGRAGLVALDLQRILLDEPVDAQQRAQRIIERFHFRLSGAVESETSHREEREEGGGRGLTNETTIRKPATLPLNPLLTSLGPSSDSAAARVQLSLALCRPP